MLDFDDGIGCPEMTLLSKQPLVGLCAMSVVRGRPTCSDRVRANHSSPSIQLSISSETVIPRLSSMSRPFEALQHFLDLVAQTIR